MTKENTTNLDSGLSNRIANLSDEKRALLLARLKQNQSLKNTSIPRRSKTLETIPLSSAQERLWFLSQLTPENATYHEAGAIQLDGQLNIDVLEKALCEIVRRHDILRTTFIMQPNGDAQQRIAFVSQVIIKHINLEELLVQQQPALIMQRICEEVRQPFNLSTGPLIRFFLFKLNTERHILLVGLHHIIADDWSVKLLIKEFSIIYDAFHNEQPFPITDLPVQYADYACWQRDWLRGESFTRQLEYWKRQLKGCPSLLELPLDMPRPTVLKNSGARYYFNISSEVATHLYQVGRSSNATLFMTLMAAFSILLNRYTQQQDICIGFPIANRSRSELQGLIGFFSNTLVLRADCTGDPRFSEFLHDVRMACLEAQNHQDLPFEKLVEELAPIRDMSHHPLFQVMFVLQNAGLEKLELPGIKLTEVAVDIGNAKFDLTLSIQEVGGELKGCFEYSTELFYETTIARLVAHYQQLLIEIGSKFDKRLSELTILPERERKQILYGWNDTVTEYPRHLCIHQLIEEQAKKKPDAVAVTFEDQRITYDQLDTRANQLAHYLRGQNIQSETCVGIFTERCLEMVIAILAVLKAGAAYVPLDPRYPKEHIAHVIEDAMLEHMLTQEKLQSSIPVQMKRFLLDTQWHEISDLRCESLESIASPENLAYVIYTSGSTGKPKGVGVTHRNIVHATSARLRYYQEPIDSFLLLSSIAFDSSVAGIFGTLCQGGCLILLSEESVLNPSMLATLISHQKISHVLTIPSLYEAILQKIIIEEQNLKSIIVAGESCKKSLVDLHYCCLPQVQLFNEYGPTEATVWSSVYHCQLDNHLPTPIGRPIANTQIYLLDVHLNPVPIGVAGQLYIGGEGLTRGYLKQASLTAMRFIPDLIGGSGGRLYQTGDLARYRSDGNIEYIGRTDYQVKIRGFRIELGEIEVALMQHPQIHQSVVIAREDNPGDKKIVAYLTGSEHIPSTDALRIYLKEILPTHMIPSIFVLLSSMPQTPNGKIDRNTLPKPDMSGMLTSSYVAPRTPVENKIAAIWGEVLGLEQVGIGDNFFQLGGHSLLAINVIEQMRQQGLHTDVRSLFITTTLAEFAVTVANNGIVKVPPNGILSDCERIIPTMLPLVTLKQEEIDSIVDQIPGGVKNIQDIYPLTPFQEGILFHHLMSAEGDPYLSSTLLSFDMREKLDHFLEALQVVINRHDILRTSAIWEELSAPVQVVWREVQLPVTEVIVNADQGDAAAQLQALYNPRHFQIDIRQAPFLRSYIAKDQQLDRWLLLILNHHLALDHMALDVLLKEVRLYSNGDIHLLREPLPFRNFVAQTRMGVNLEEQEAFFQELLGDIQKPTAPFGLLNNQGDGSDVVETIQEVDHVLSQRIYACARSLGVSAASLFHLAWAQLLAHTTGNRDVVFGTVLFGRAQGYDDAERMLGMFINTLPIRFSINGESVKASIKLMHTLLAKLLLHEHASLAVAQRCSALPAPMPLFSTLLNYRHSRRFIESGFAEGAPIYSGMKILQGEERTNYPIALSIDDYGDGFHLVVQVQRGVESERICTYIESALKNLVFALESGGSSAICSLNVLTDEERAQLLTDWHGSEVGYPERRCIHEIFEE
ncbi:MAG: amino acid adenylation domain-containing protein, partial [Nitrosomonas sp.]